MKTLGLLNLRVVCRAFVALGAFLLLWSSAASAAQRISESGRIAVVLAEAVESVAKDEANQTMDVYRTELRVSLVLKGDQAVRGKTLTDLRELSGYLDYPTVVVGHRYFLVLDGKKGREILFAYDASVSPEEHEALASAKQQDAHLGSVDCSRFNTLFGPGLKRRDELEVNLKAFVDAIAEEQPALALAYECFGQPLERMRSVDGSVHTYRTGEFTLPDVGRVVYIAQLAFGGNLAITRVRVSPSVIRDDGTSLTLEKDIIDRFNLLEEDVLFRDDE
jgi:hypothetical protein